MERLAVAQLYTNRSDFRPR